MDYPRYPESEYLAMKVAITLEYSKEYHVPFEDVVDLFVQKGVYEMIDEGRDQFIMRMCPYMVEYVHDWIYSPELFA